MRFILAVFASFAFIWVWAVPSAHAVTVTFVGSWSVSGSAAPTYTSGGEIGPRAYTAQEAAAHLFGGSAADYIISTAGRAVADVNFKGWYDVMGAGGFEFAQDYDNRYLGAFYGPVDGMPCCDASLWLLNPASAWVDGSHVTGINYAFRIVSVTAVPLPPSAHLILAAIACLAFARRRATEVVTPV